MLCDGDDNSNIRRDINYGRGGNGNNRGGGSGNANGGSGWDITNGGSDEGGICDTLYPTHICINNKKNKKSELIKFF